jgi:hypothetical protein
VDGADQKRADEQAESKLHAQLAEIPRVGVDNERDAEGEDRDGRRSEHERSDDETQAPGKAANRARLGISQHGCNHGLHKDEMWCDPLGTSVKGATAASSASPMPSASGEFTRARE